MVGAKPMKLTRTIPRAAHATHGLPSACFALLLTVGGACQIGNAPAGSGEGGKIGSGGAAGGGSGGSAHGGSGGSGKGGLSGSGGSERGGATGSGGLAPGGSGSGGVTQGEGGSGSGGSGRGGAGGLAGSGGSAAGGSSGDAGAGGASPTGGATGTGGSGSAYANFASVTDVALALCGGSDCHNPGNNPPSLLDEATLYSTLMTFVADKCGKRLLVKPGAPTESAFYLAQMGQCGTDLPRMPKGCVDNCTPPDYLDGIRQWIQNGAPRR
jgi:hypothetical protein